MTEKADSFRARSGERRVKTAPRANFPTRTFIVKHLRACVSVKRVYIASGVAAFRCCARREQYAVRTRQPLHNRTVKIL